MGRTVNTSALVVTLLFAAKAAVLAGEADPENRDLFTSSSPPANIEAARNESIVSDLGSAYVDAQLEYFRKSRHPDGGLVLAEQIRSSPGARDAGFHSFLVNHLGDVYSRELSPETNRTAAGRLTFNPDSKWKRVSSSINKNKERFNELR